MLIADMGNTIEDYSLLTVQFSVDQKKFLLLLLAPHVTTKSISAKLRILYPIFMFLLCTFLYFEYIDA